MRRLSPTSRWVVLPTVAVTTTFVVAVASAQARSDGGGRGDARSSGAAQGIAPRADARDARSIGEPAHRLWPTERPGRGQRPGPRPTRPGRPTARPSTPPTASPTGMPAPTPTTAAPTTTRPPAPPAPTTTAPAGVTDQVVALTNTERAKAGCGPLSVNPVLTAVAQAHSQDMATNNYFSHDSQDGRSPFDRMTAGGYRYSTAAENIAAGQRTPQDVMTAWMNSAGHKANILNCALKEIGVGYATGSGSYGAYWTQDFGTPR
jgi:uncharacterized protein YkwD